MKKLLTTIAAAIGIAVGSATALADSINLSEVTANTNVVDGTTLTGTLGANVQISIADGATVTLDGVAINGVNDEDCGWAGITCEGGATIILEGTNTVKGFYENYPGIYVPEGKTLTITGDGSLDASSNGYGAGIGGGYDISCGNIVIEGGTIVATGGYLATGIGGGGNVSCGAITIVDTVTKVVATKYELNTPRSIGSGVGGSCGTVTIGGTVYPDGITQSPYIYPTYTATLKDGTEDAANWTITPSEGISESNTVTVAYAGENKVKSVKAVAIPLTLSVATAEDVGKVVCADGHLHDAKTAVPDGCTAVGILGKVTEKGHGLILALQNASSQTWNTINGWTSTTGYAGTTLKVLPDDAARGANLTSYIALGDTPVSDWAVGQKSDYEAIFINLGSTTVNSGTIYDGNVNAYFTTGVGGTAISGDYWSATDVWGNYAWGFSSDYWHSYVKAYTYGVRPVLGFGGEATEEIAVTPVEGKPNEWTFQMPDGDVEVEVAYLAVATFEVDGETYAVTTNVVGEAVATPSEDPVKAGHSFAGWFTEATGGTQVTDETLMGTADTTFYAQFREPILTIENGVLTAVDFNGCTDIDLVIPDTVTAIGDSVFYQCTGLASVTIPGSVKTISHAAFRDCTGLTSVTIEEGVTTIGERAFARCVNLASITIPGTVTEISEAAFSDCKSLTSLTIPGSVKTIGPQAFQNCTGLESVTLEEGVETIGRVAFDGCENLSSVTIPDSVKEIGDDAFSGCSDALYEEGSGNLSGVKLVDGWAVGHDAGSISENLDLTGVRGIAGGAFAGCDVITSVIIPDGVATIPEYVFNGCDNLTGVTIPDSVTSIGEGAFGGCDNLASVTIPDSVTSIGKDAFEGCSEELFDTTTIPGVALVDGWAVGYTDALPENLDLTGARGIADNAFRESALESVTIPGTVARVPAGAFMSCTSLASVTLEEGVTAIDDSAFIECSALESVEIPDTVTAIGPQAFVACAKLASVTVPGSVGEIGPAAFGMCNSLTNVTIEAGVTNIGMMAFAMCSALESLELPGTVTAIGAQAFLMSMNLASVTIPASVKEIGKDAFLYTALSTVYVEYGDVDRVKALLAASGFDTDNLEFVETSSPLPVYRFYSKNYKGHFFTIDEEEKEYIIANNRNWSFEGTAYRAFTNQVPGTVALHRFYSKNYRGHFFTIDEEEAETIRLTNKNWAYEGVAYYVYPSEVEGSVPVYRFWSKRYRHHFYTTNEEEKDNLRATNPNWSYEGVAFWAIPDNTGNQKSAKDMAIDGSASNDANADAGTPHSIGQVSPEVESGVVPWMLATWPDCEPVATDGVTVVGGLVVEVSADAPDTVELDKADGETFVDALPLLLALPDGAWRATLQDAQDDTVADENATGVFGFILPANGLWHWLRVRDAERDDANADDAFSLWLRAE